MKRFKIILEFKSKDKIRYKASNNILEKADDAISSIEKGHIERCQKTEEHKNSDGIAERKEKGWEVVKYYLYDDLTLDSEDNE